MQAMQNAEGGYVKVMRAVSHVNLIGDCDGAAMRSALQRFSDMPYILSEVGPTHLDHAPASLGYQQAL